MIKILLTVALLVAALPCAAQERSQTGLRLAQGVFLTAQVGDLVSTHIAVQRPGIVEGNALMGQSEAQRIALKAAGTAGILWLTSKLATHHPRVATVTLYALSGSLGAVAIHNFTIARR